VGYFIFQAPQISMVKGYYSVFLGTVLYTYSQFSMTFHVLI